MNEKKVEQTRQARAAAKWARSDPCDPYRQHLLDAVLEHGGPEAWEALLSEIENNP